MHDILITASTVVAQAEQKLAEATARRDTAANRVAGLEAQIAAQVERQAEVRRRFKLGEVSEREAGGISGLIDADIADLRVLLTEANAALVAAEPHAERNALAIAREALGRAEALETVRQLREVAAAADARLIAALAAAGPILRRAGLPYALGSVWKASRELQQALTFGSFPGAVRRAA